MNAPGTLKGGSAARGYEKEFSFGHVNVVIAGVWSYWHVAWQGLKSIQPIDGPVAKRLDGRKKEEEKASRGLYGFDKISGS